MTQIDTFTDILRARSSCRAFRPDPVDDALIAEAEALEGVRTVTPLSF